MSNSQTHPGKKSKVAGRAMSSAKPSAISIDKNKSGQDAVASSPHAEMSAEERHRQIADAAYYRAMRRGFHGGSDLEDWLASEAEIDKLLWHGGRASSLPKRGD
jgi:hypothetical protein